jgi:hypothetical protein
MKENYVQVAMCILRNADDTSFVDVPVYIKVSELGGNGLAVEEEKLLHKISGVLMSQYEKKILQKLATQTS